MEGNGVGVSTAAGTPASSRWNPTKEQINMLESLYRQGIRTPSAELIQQITTRLKGYGHIEGKNVFYWFQNHKARQRQKQKQESLAYVNRYLHQALPLFPPSLPPAGCPNVVRGPYWLPQSDLGFYPQYPKVLLPGGIRRKPRPYKAEKTKTYGGGAGYEPAHPRQDIMIRRGDNNEEAISNTSGCKQETLPLFPLHPTGILQGREEASSSLASFSVENFSMTPSISSDTTGVEEGSGDEPFFNFFAGGNSCESD